MAIRTLTIGSMKRSGFIYLSQVANTDRRFSGKFGRDTGMIKFERSSSGNLIRWDTDVNHIRIYVELEGPEDLPFITYTSSGVGWAFIEGYEQISLGDNGVMRRNQREALGPLPDAPESFGDIHDLEKQIVQNLQEQA